ncbi:MAG TPA: DUF4864 domain-containing protein [Alphaproteobacteria bacterium]|nr:DUF4864 domain-containing protein [Alphaproteobacteria bacterium]
MMPQARLVAAAAVAAALALPVPTFAAAEPLLPNAWQHVISNQIQAFRDNDATTAFQYAGLGFQERFQDAQSFFNATVAAGYNTIMDSRTENFGSYRQFDDSSVLQEVTLFGNDQSLYTAVFAMAEEPGGWRIEAVILKKQDGVGV